MGKIKIKTYNDTAIFVAGHAMILGHKPDTLSLAQISSKLEDDPQELSQFGLFDRATPNYSTYYPEVTKKDLEPTEDEFVEPVFRMLSNITVNARHNPIYFPESVLKKNMYKMVGQTVNIDHEMAVGNAIGSVKSVEWQRSYTANGIKVPAGFNAVLKIDGKSNPRIARGIMMDPPSIHSNSVTVNFEWKKSHAKMDDNDFYNKLGTPGPDGKLVQRVVVDIRNFHETSLVSHGADPFAQKIVDGKIVNPTYAGQNYSLSADKDGFNKLCLYDWKQLETSNDTTSFNTTEFNTINTDKNSKQMDIILRFLETLHGLDAESLTEENYEAEIKKINDALVANQKPEKEEPIVILEISGKEAIEAEITSLREFKSNTPEDMQAKIALSTIGQTAIDDLKAETERFYKLSIEEGKEDAAILAVIAGADYLTLKSLFTQYEKLSEDKFALTCDDCHSTNISRASANPKENTEENGITQKSTQEVIDQLTSGGTPKLPSSLQGGK